MAKYWTTPGITLWFLVLVFTSVSLVEVDSEREGCTSPGDNPYLYFGTRTSYETVRNPGGIPRVPECRPLQVWMVARHGAHYTNLAENSKFVNMMDLRDQILNNHGRGRGSLCQEQLQQLRSWREYLVSSQEEDSLTPQGLRDAYTLGASVRQALPEIFEGSNASRDFVVHHTEMGKTKKTAAYFIKGLFGFDNTPELSNTYDTSNLLEGFENCPAWSRKNAKIQEKVDLLTKGELMAEVHRNVSERLGFNYDLPFYVVDAMYNWCVREKSISIEAPSPWCHVFAESELKVMEFVDDIQYYFKTGPGDRTGMNKKLGCPLVRDMLHTFKEVEMNPDAQRPKGVFYFGEVETVGLVASRLGLMTDRRPQNSASYIHQGRRTFRTSALLPWGANIMAVFFQCSSGETNRVMFLVSEYVVTLPGCPSGLCPWSLVQHRLSHSLGRSCSLDFCTRLPHPWIPLTNVELWSIVAFISTVLFIVHLFIAVNRLTA